ncbi:MAG TPA: hypothetical protein VF534_01900 [Paraburkholderia sp.]
MSQEQIRACSTCCAFEGGECMNGLGAVHPDDVCELHNSVDEDRREDEAMGRFRTAIGLPHRRSS